MRIELGRKGTSGGEELKFRRHKGRSSFLTAKRDIRKDNDDYVTKPGKRGREARGPKERESPWGGGILFLTAPTLKEEK